jgi:hypothetical protein
VAATARRHPLPVRIFDVVQRSLVALGRAPAKFAASEAALLDAARKRTGLDDFGDAAFREGLRVLLRAYDEESRLSPFGRLMVRGELTTILANRLRVEHAWRQRPAILDQPIRRPLFILGLPRSGTTALHFLLAQDPANQVLEYWLAAAPGPRPPRESWARDPRFKAARQALRLTYYLDPTLKAIHWMTVDGPDECRHLLLQSFVDHTFDSNASIPGYTKWFEAQDMRPAYERHRDVLRLIGSPTPERRWVLKYPAHLRNLRALLDVYPDACIVQTHRDPASVLPSICSLVAGWRSLYEGRVDAHAIGRQQLDLYAQMIETGLAVRARSPSAQFFDLDFREVLADPIAAVRRSYDHFGFEWTPAGESAMRSWHEQNPQGKHGEHRYSASEYGLDASEMDERFAGYVDRFGLKRAA